MSVFALFALLLANVSCNKEDNSPGFDLFYQREFSIPAGIGVFQIHHFELKNIPSRYAETLLQYGKTDADITQIVTKEASLSGVFGDADLSYIDEVSVRVSRENDLTDYIEVAYRQPVPLDPGNELPLIPSLADSKRIVQNDRLNLDVVIRLRTTTVDETSARLVLVLKAKF